MPKAMPHPKLVPKSPPPTLRLMSKMKPAPRNILDEETESDNHPGDRPALPRRPVMRPTLTSNDRWYVPDGSDTDISLQRESVHPGPFGNSKFLNFVYEYYMECSTILETNPDFHFIPEHERQHGAKCSGRRPDSTITGSQRFKVKVHIQRTNTWTSSRRSTAFAATPMLSQKFSEQTSFRWYVTTAILISRRPSRTLSRFANTSTWIRPRQNRSPTSILWRIERLSRLFSGRFRHDSTLGQHRECKRQVDMGLDGSVELCDALTCITQARNYIGNKPGLLLMAMFPNHGKARFETGHTMSARQGETFFQEIDGSTTSPLDPHTMHSGLMARISSMIPTWIREMQQRSYTTSRSPIFWTTPVLRAEE